MSAALLCLILVVYHEARGEPLAGQAAVAIVVINRTNDPRYPQGICAVVKQPGQFPIWWDAPILDDRAWQQAKMIAESAIAGDIIDMTGGAKYFARHNIRPYWSKGMTRQRLGSHVFYTQPEQNKWIVQR